ncbi:MAG: methyltransferase [Ardenticatenia bacterium]|nr:methyltransferase [Ardenticatenia bacterium]
MSATTALLFTTNPGLEDIVAREFVERLRAQGLERCWGVPKPYGLSGYARGEAAYPRSVVEPLAHEMRSVYHVLRPVHEFRLPEGDALGAIRDELCRVEIPELRAAHSFRVSTERVGQHPFTSLDIMREAGAALVERYNCDVNLTGYEVNVRVDVYHDLCLVGLQLTREPLDRRFPRVYHHRAALKAVVAYGLLRLAHLERAEGALLDPFCGSGTILLEAAFVMPAYELHGCDVDSRAVEGARQNAALLGLVERVHLRCADALHLAEVYAPGTFEAIITNPPYGVRVGRGLNFYRFYTRFLAQAHHVLCPDGRLVLLARRRGALNRAVRDHGGFECATCGLVRPVASTRRSSSWNAGSNHSVDSPGAAPRAWSSGAQGRVGVQLQSR